MISLVGKKAVQLELPNHLNIHNVINVIHTVPYNHQPTEIAAPDPVRPDPVPAMERDEYQVECILKHRKRRRGFQFLT